MRFACGMITNSELTLTFLCDELPWRRQRHGRRLCRPKSTCRERAWSASRGGWHGSCQPRLILITLRDARIFTWLHLEMPACLRARAPSVEPLPSNCPSARCWETVGECESPCLVVSSLPSVLKLLPALLLLPLAKLLVGVVHGRPRSSKQRLHDSIRGLAQRPPWHCVDFVPTKSLR